VSLEVSELREALAAGRFLTEERLYTSVRSGMNLKMGLLIEAFMAVWHAALVTLLRFLIGFRFFLLYQGVSIDDWTNRRLVMMWYLWRRRRPLLRA
jgi:hypothetical protein